MRLRHVRQTFSDTSRSSRYFRSCSRAWRPRQFFACGSSRLILTVVFGDVAMGASSARRTMCAPVSERHVCFFFLLFYWAERPKRRGLACQQAEPVPARPTRQHSLHRRLKSRSSSSELGTTKNTVHDALLEHLEKHIQTCSQGARLLDQFVTKKWSHRLRCQGKKTVWRSGRLVEIHRTMTNMLSPRGGRSSGLGAAPPKRNSPCSSVSDLVEPSSMLSLKYFPIRRRTKRRWLEQEQRFIRPCPMRRCSCESS